MINSSKQNETLKPYKIFTLIYVMKDNKMLLGLKKRGFAKGYNINMINH